MEKTIKNTTIHQYHFSYDDIVELLMGCVEGIPHTVKESIKYKYTKDPFYGDVSKDFAGIELSWEEENND